MTTDPAKNKPITGSSPAEMNASETPEAGVAMRGNDEVIGVAFRRSLVVVVVAALVVGGVVLIANLGSGPAPVDDAPVLDALDQESPEGLVLPEIPFTDVTAQAGIDFVHESGARGEKLLPETMGGGVAFLDYDVDGDQDLLLVNSDIWPWDRSPGEKRPTMALYRNEGSGRFEDVTEEAGLARPIYGMAPAVGDMDNDGDPDLFITAVGPNLLLRNDGGRFVEVTDEAGVGGEDDAWSTAAAWLDVDGDGLLDLVVTNYVVWSREIDLKQGFSLTGEGRSYGPPLSFEGERPYLYRNLGDGTFEETAEHAGLVVRNQTTGEPAAKSLGIAPVDLNGDGHLDMVIANDTVRNFAFINRGDGTFDEQGVELGIAFDSYGKARGAMGIDTTSLWEGEDLTIAIGNFANEMSALYTAEQPGSVFSDDAITAGIGPATRLALTFGVIFFDADLDGRQDLLQANGHVENEIQAVQRSQRYRQSAQLFWNTGGAGGPVFALLPEEAVGDLTRPIVGRGAAYADVDGDGDLDVVLTQTGGPALLLRNDQALGGNWVRVRLIGRSSNRDAIGAVLRARVGGGTLLRRVMPTRSYLSQVERVVTFGLGEAARIDELEITWPDGSTQTVGELGAGVVHEIIEP